jgi:ABC-type oligopeptide transport system substrate-binding subunit
MIVVLISLLFGLAGCRNTAVLEESSQIVVTEVYVIADEEIVITRVIELTPTPTPPPTDAPEKELGPVELDIAFVRDSPPLIDPQQSISQDGIDLVENLFVGLTRYNHQTNEIAPALAEEWEVSEDGRTWTFHLRDDIFWVRPTEAGEAGLYQVEAVRPVTAGDVVAAVQRACRIEPDLPDAFNLFIIQGCQHVHSRANPTPADLEAMGVQALNDTTLQFTLTKPAAHFLALTSLWFMRPLPAELVQMADDEEQATEEPQLLTSGPYFPLTPELQTLHLNPLWPLPRQGNVEIVNITYADEPQNTLQLWQDRQLDLIEATDLEADFTEERLAARLQLVPGHTLYYLGFNFDSGVFREQEVRRAFAAAIDRERLVEELFGLQATGMRHLIPPGTIGALPVDEAGVGYSPDYARQQLAESGFSSCRLMPPITFLVSSSDLSLQQAELIQRMWIEELDCAEEQIIIDQVQFGTLLANIRPDAAEARPDIWELAWAAYYPDAHNWMGELLHCEESENPHNRPCDEADDLIRQANDVLDTAERTTLYRQLENAFFGDAGTMPIIPLYIQNELRLVQSWLTYTPALFGGEQFDTYLLDAEKKELEQSR